MAVPDKKKETTAQGGYPVQVCKYDSVRDAEEVISGLNCDINDMLQTGIVRDSGETLEQNDITDPNAIIGRIEDPFDAIDAARVIEKHGRKSASQNSSEAGKVATQGASDE